MNLTNKTPNTTLLLPGSCNADCSFCFWNKEQSKIKPPTNYLDKVFEQLGNLPSQFKTLSISGGEPTLSQYFTKVLSKLAKFRRSRGFDRVVLTTNAGNLLPNLLLVGAAVDHINISRHGISTSENYRVFGTDKVPADDELIEIIKQTHKLTDCDVTLNCVVNPDVSTDFIYSFIDYAKAVGADAVSFRKTASDVSPTFAEYAFATKYGVVDTSACPVCRGMSQIVDGFDVRWKGSVLEPSIETGGVYELVIHPDANVYSDWGMTQPVEFKVVPKQVSTRCGSSSRTTGCGGKTAGCGSSSRTTGCGGKTAGCGG